jgi:hypothetical protein
MAHEAVTAAPLDCHATAGCVYSVATKGHYRCTVHNHTHLCSRAQCDSRFVGDDAQITCGRTGRWMGAAMALVPHAAVVRGAARTAAAPSSEKPPPRDPFRAVYRERQRRDAEGLLATLLFGPGREVAANTRRERAMAGARSSVRRHCREQRRAGLRPDGAVVRDMCRSAAASAGPAPSSDVAPDTTSIVQNLLSVWSDMATTPYTRENVGHVRFLDVALAVLYLRGGGGVEWGAGDERLPKSALLADLLPPLSDLRYLDIDVKAFTRGRNHLFKAWRSAATPRPSPPRPSPPRR